MNVETKGLGAGSYPEPPFVPASSSPMCDMCGDPDELLEVGGMVLCRSCREKFYLEACRDKMWDFINAQPMDVYNFAVDYWFHQLPKSDQGRVAMEALKREFAFPLYYNEYQLNELIKNYATEFKSEFADYMDKLEAREVVA